MHTIKKVSKVIKTNTKKNLKKKILQNINNYCLQDILFNIGKR